MNTSRDLVFLKLQKSDLSLVDAYFIDNKVNSEFLAFHDIIKDGDYFMMSGMVEHFSDMGD